MFSALRIIPKGLVALTLLLATAICLFSHFARPSGDQVGDLALFIGSEAYGSFLTEEQRDELDLIAEAYGRGDFLDLLIAAPKSLKQSGHPPFVVAEYLHAKGIPDLQIRLDDEADSLASLTQKLRGLLAFGNYKAPLVFTPSVDIPLTKTLMRRAGIKAGFRSVKSMEISLLPIAGIQTFEIAKLSLFARSQQLQEDMGYSPNTTTSEELLIKPLDLLTDNDVNIAWLRAMGERKVIN